MKRGIMEKEKTFGGRKYGKDAQREIRGE